MNLILETFAHIGYDRVQATLILKRRYVYLTLSETYVGYEWRLDTLLESKCPITLWTNFDEVMEEVRKRLFL
jgi:hypothetical protein